MSRYSVAALLAFSLLLLAAPGAAQDQFFDADGVRLRYIDAGRGEPIVMLHGNGGNLGVWQATGVAKSLAEDYRVILFDARGHGLSDKPHDATAYGRQMALDVVRLLDHLGISRAHVVGYSMGGNITSQLLTLHPERVLSAVLIAGPGRMDWSKEEEERVQVEAAEMERDCISRTQMLRLAPPDDKPTEDELRAASQACMANPTRDRFAVAAVRRGLAGLVVTSTAVAAVRVPTFAVVGSLDPDLLEATKKVKRLRPDMPMVVVEGATHNSIPGAPETLAVIRGFLRSMRQN